MIYDPAARALTVLRSLARNYRVLDASDLARALDGSVHPRDQRRAIESAVQRGIIYQLHSRPGLYASRTYGGV